MKIKNIFYLILLILFSFISCAQKASSSKNSEKENGNKTPSATLEIDSKVSEFECNGEGEELSGKYLFSLSEGKGSCKNEKSMDPATKEVKDTYICTQKDSKFECKSPMGKLFSGCINKDGKFKFLTDDDFDLLNAISLQAHMEEDSEKSSIVGTIDSDQGQIQYLYNSKWSKHENCLFTWNLEVTEVNN